MILQYNFQDMKSTSDERPLLLKGHISTRSGLTRGVQMYTSKYAYKFQNEKPITFSCTDSLKKIFCTKSP